MAIVGSGKQRNGIYKNSCSWIKEFRMGIWVYLFCYLDGIGELDVTELNKCI